MADYNNDDDYDENNYDNNNDDGDDNGNDDEQREYQSTERYEDTRRDDEGDDGYTRRDDRYQERGYVQDQQGYQEEQSGYQQEQRGYEQSYQSEQRGYQQEQRGYQQADRGYEQSYQQPQQHSYQQSGSRGIQPGQYGQQQQQAGQMQYQNQAPQNGGAGLRRKSLLIGINYEGSDNALEGCRQDVRNMSQFLASRGYPTDPRSMVILTDDQQGNHYASGRNIMAAFDWLVSEPGFQCFLHYSGHGGQVPDEDGDRASGFDDTICPVDYAQNGQISSDVLHRQLVSKLAPSNQLFVVLDCCHSGSALELPFVYRTDSDGNVNLMDDLKQGIHLVGAAEHLIQGGFTIDKIGEAKQLYAGATDFFQGLKHFGQQKEEGLGQDQFSEDWAKEKKAVFMFSGCKDDQTSADASIGGSHVGAMSWALLKTLNSRPDLSYVQVLQQTRQLLMGNYTQVPQLSVGIQVDLNQPLHI